MGNFFLLLKFIYLKLLTSTFSSPVELPPFKNGFSLVYQEEFNQPMIIPNDNLETCEHWGFNHICRKDGGMWNPDGSIVPPDDPLNYIEWNPNQVYINHEKGWAELTTKINLKLNETKVHSGEICTIKDYPPNTFFEVRMKVTNNGNFGWNACVLYNKTTWPPEIDFAEFECDGSDKYTTTIHPSKYSKKWSPKIDLSDTFHTYGCYWKSDCIEFYLDDILLWVYRGDEVPQVPMYLMVCNAVKQSFNPDNYTQHELNELFPFTLYVDYIRIYR